MSREKMKGANLVNFYNNMKSLKSIRQRNINMRI